MTIAEENANRIRTPMEVVCGISARLDTTLTFAYDGWLNDILPLDSLGSDEYLTAGVTDLNNGGFPVDGSVVWFRTDHWAGLDDPKIGLISDIGTPATITVTAPVSVVALTLTCDGEGTITANGVDYELRQNIVIPMGAKTMTMTFTPSQTQRITVFTILPGIFIEFDNSTLIRCNVALRSDLGRTSNWQVSELEFSAYYPQDISGIIAQIGEGSPIYYYAGYPGDYSETRYFYVSDPAVQEGNVVTIKAEDASAKLSQTTIATQLLKTAGHGAQQLVSLMKRIVKEAGITLVHSEGASQGVEHAATRLLIPETSADAIIADINNLAHGGADAWPTFIDAGIPRIKTHRPDTAGTYYPAWEITESECGDVSREWDKTLSKLTTDSEDGLNATVTESTDKVEKGNIATKKVVAGGKYTIKFDGAYTNVTVTGKYALNNLTITASKATFTATRADTVYITGKPIIVSGGKKKITKSGIGDTLSVSPVSFGALYFGDTFLYPNYNRIFNRSVATGSFVWKGNPHMQPRDIFTFHQLDGTDKVCTIESIEMTHEGGGTSAVITYREGVI